MIDLQDNAYFKGNLADKQDLEAFANKVIEDHGHVDYLINLNYSPLYGESGSKSQSYCV